MGWNKSRRERYIRGRLAHRKRRSRSTFKLKSWHCTAKRFGEAVYENSAHQLPQTQASDRSETYKRDYSFMQGPRLKFLRHPFAPGQLFLFLLLIDITIAPFVVTSGPGLDVPVGGGGLAVMAQQGLLFLHGHSIVQYPSEGSPK